MLVRYIRLFLDGQRSVVPFVSDVSASYIKAFRKSKADTESARRDEALAKAQGTWAPFEHENGPPPPCSDSYYRAAFGEAGPVADQARFHEVAVAVFENDQPLVT